MLGPREASINSRGEIPCRQSCQARFVCLRPLCPRNALNGPGQWVPRPPAGSSPREHYPTLQGGRVRPRDLLPTPSRLAASSSEASALTRGHALFSLLALTAWGFPTSYPPLCKWSPLSNTSQITQLEHAICFLLGS